MRRFWSSWGRTVLVLAMIVAAGWAVFHRPPPSRPPSAPSASASASTPPPPEAPTPSPGELSYGPVPSVDPSASEPAPSPPTSCPPGQELASEILEHTKTGSGCANAGANAPDAGRTKQGLWVVRAKNGDISAGKYVDNRREGTWITWYAAGGKAMLITYGGGTLDGPEIEWLPSGQVFALRTYKQGMLDGVVEIHHPEGGIEKQYWLHGHRVEGNPF